MSNTVSNKRQLALLIDADNASAAYLTKIMQKIATLGQATTRRAYGNWASSHLAPWKDILLRYCIEPIHQFSYTKGKNAIDISLVIDAMDLLYTGQFDGFCIVSSDSDFTSLAQCIRKQGLLAYGFGRQTTPQSLVKACDQFIHLETLNEQKPVATNNPPKNINTAITSDNHTINKMADDKGLTNIAPKAQISKTAADCDRRFFGHAQFEDFFKADAKNLKLQQQDASHLVEDQPPEPNTDITPKKPNEQKPTIANNPSDDKSRNINAAIAWVKQAINALSDDEGFTNITPVKSRILDSNPDFDTQVFGYEKFGHFLRAYPDHFKLKQQDSICFVKNRLPEQDTDVASEEADKQEPITADNVSYNPPKDIYTAIALVAVVINKTADNEGFACTWHVLSTIYKYVPNFDTQLFGYEKFSDFLKAYPEYFELRQQDGNYYVKDCTLEQDTNAAPEEADEQESSIADNPPDNPPWDVNATIALVKQTISALADDEGFAQFAHITGVKNRILESNPDFDIQALGYKTFGDFLKAYPEDFELKRQDGLNLAKNRLPSDEQIPNIKNRLWSFFGKKIIPIHCFWIYPLFSEYLLEQYHAV